MAHAAKFLKLVNEAKKKIKETNVAEVKRRVDGEKSFCSWMSARTTNGPRDIFRRHPFGAWHH